MNDIGGGVHYNTENEYITNLCSRKRNVMSVVVKVCPNLSPVFIMLIYYLHDKTVNTVRPSWKGLNKAGLLNC